jgi:hypothetical protein
MKQNEKCCGNCKHHCPWDYPKTVFCELEFVEGTEIKNSVKKTIDNNCSKWEKMSMSGDCNCVKDAKVKEMA